jgi:hypothetical protein
VAAHKFGMSAIGFEKDPGYFEHCRRRLERELQPSSRPSLW